MDERDALEVAEDGDRERHKAAKRARRAWRSVLATQAGREVLEEIVNEWCRSLHTIQSGAGEFELGRRSIGSMILMEAARHNGDAAMRIAAGGLGVGDRRGGDDDDE